jgi:hypothetical protein
VTAVALPRLSETLDGQEPGPNDARLWGVTTIIGCIEKPALVYWAAKQTALAAIADGDIWQPMHARNEADAVRWLSNARFRPPVGSVFESAELGSAVHVACQHYAIFGARPEVVHPEVVPFLDQFDRWLDRFQPTYEAAEVVVYSPKYGYAGTADTFLSVPEQADADPVRLLVDYKTSREPRDAKGKPKRPYMETVLQLAAYRYAELAAVWRARRMEVRSRRYYLLDPAEQALAVPVPEVDGCGCLLITPESCDLFPMRADRRAFDAFLFTLEVARYTLQDSRGAVGDPMIPPDRGDTE